MNDNSIPWTPDDNVEPYDNVVACMTRKGLPLPPRHLLADIESTYDALTELGEIGPDSWELFLHATVEEFGPLALGPAAMELLGFAFTGIGLLAPLYYIGELEGCVMRVMAMKPPPDFGSQPLPVDPGPRPDVWPIAPAELKPPPEPPPATKSGPSLPTRVGRTLVAAAAAGVLIYTIPQILENNSSAPLPVLTGNTPVILSTTPYYLHWDCGGSSQCAADMGGDSGIRAGLGTLDYDQCQTDLRYWAANNIMQTRVGNSGPGAWCDTS